MKVIAKSLGFYGDKRRYPGEVFELVARKIAYTEKGSDRVLHKQVTAEQQFSENWMEAYEPKAASKGKLKSKLADESSEPDEI